MDSEELLKHIDHQRWLMNNGLFSDSAKNQLFMYGSVVHKDIKAVELDIDVEKKLVNYKLYIDKSLLKKVEQYHALSKATGFFELRKFKKLLKEEGDLDFRKLLSGFVRDYCGPKWAVAVTPIDFTEYSEGFDNGVQGEANSIARDKQSDG